MNLWGGMQEEKGLIEFLTHVYGLNSMISNILIGVVAIIFLVSLFVKVVLNGTQFFEFVDKKKRNKIGSVEEYLKEEKRVSPYIKVLNDFCCEVRELTLFEKFTYWFNVVVGTYSLCVAFVALIFAAVYVGSVFIKIGSLIFFVFVMFVAAWFFMQNAPENAAKKIRSILTK